MKDIEVKNKIKQIMSKLFKVDSSFITSETVLGDIDGWDSLQHMNLVATLEDEFGIEIDEDEYEEMVSFRMIYSVVSSYEDEN